ncbi:hypothetical protein Tco_0556711 [Tanacetum coccineum]
MKTKVARYEIVGIEDMVPTLWSTIKLGYNKDVEKGIKHWGGKHQLWYKSQLNKFSKHKVYYTHKILSMVSVKGKKLHAYGHLEEIMVRRADRQLYKFKEGDFIDLHLNNIKDMLLLVVQHKYNDDMPRRKWMAVDKRRSGLMVELIDKQMLERWII